MTWIKHSIVCLLLCLATTGCHSSGPTVQSSQFAPAAAAEKAIKTRGLFEDVSEKAGIHFKFTNGATGKHYLVETTGSGCAFFDYDNDGRPDILLLQAGPLPNVRILQNEPANRLYHNNGDGTFSNATSGSGLENTGYSQGVAIGDFDGDGFDDVFVTGLGGNHLFKNLHGTGKFLDVTNKAGLSDTQNGSRWCTSAAFGDYDNDGKLDLYVCRYAKYSLENDKACKNPKGQPSYCSPELYPADEHALYRNNGDGTFTDVSKKAGITGHFGHGLAVAWLDYDGDGWEDIFVANDLSPYMLWHNNRDGTFTEVGQDAGVAYSDMGQLLSGMGIACRDFFGTGRENLFVTNFSGQMNALYRNDGKGRFTNVTIPSGIGPISVTHLAFGCEAIDFDRDGKPDIIVGNGHVNEDVEAYSQGSTYAQPKSLLRNNGDGTFTDVKEGLGDAETPRVTRGLAVADYDGDGHLDILANNQDGTPQLLHYSGPSHGHWIAFDTRGTKSNPDGYHAKVTVKAGRQTYFAEVRSGSSFGSHSHSRLYFGLGDAVTVDEVKIVWHGSKNVTVGTNLGADRTYRCVEGQHVMLAQLLAGKKLP